jgi:starch phosphorylase
MPTLRTGAEDVRFSADQLAARLPSALAPLARIAFNYRWCWTLGGPELFSEVDPHRWQACRQNPLRLLQETSTARLEQVAADRELIRRAYSLEECIATECSRLPTDGTIDAGRPVAFFCAEYGIHASLPVYAGGLGVLAGDLVKAASDTGLPLVAVGLLYQQGYFRQQLDLSGWQQEYWVHTDPPRLPGAPVTVDGTQPLKIAVPIRGRDVAAQIWRFDIGRVPLYLLDTDLPENPPVDRWITSRLYVGDRETRLSQYALLGIGGVLALRAMGIDPGLLHLNEGHAALAPLQLATHDVADGHAFADALARARSRTHFTTHTPVPAGNETYASEEFRRVFAGLDERLGTDWESILDMTRATPGDADAPPGMTALGLRVSRSSNGVSERHGAVARGIWRPLFGVEKDAEVPIGFVTNGVHLPTWMATPMRQLLSEHLGPGWESPKERDAVWDRIAEIPDAELWRIRCELRARLVAHVRTCATQDRLSRGETPGYVELAAQTFDPDTLTIGFARRLATYKRLYLVSRDLPRALSMLTGPSPLQIVLAGKAHPQDDGAKRVVQQLFETRHAPQVGERIAYLHDYDMQMAAHLVSGCDVWVNLPRPPLEASGTSGMKAALNGGLNLSVLDGWWPEAYDGSNGWSISGEEDDDPEAQDNRDAQALLDLMENEVIPLFYERDADGVPRGWMQRVKASLRTVGAGFTSRRMLGDYIGNAYRHESGGSAGPR